MARGRWWAFDRPVWRDRLLLVGVLVGVAFVVLSPPPPGSWLAAAADVVASVVAGVLVTGAVGGFVRNVSRALDDDEPPRGRQ